MAALIISHLLAILIIIFFSSSSSAVSSSPPTLKLPVYHFPGSQLYQVKLSNMAFVPVDTGNDVALFKCIAKTPSIGTVSCQNKTLCKMVQPTGCAAGCTFKREYSGSKVTAILVQGDIALLGGLPGNNFTYGCVNKSSSDSFQGLLSLGRGPLSLLNQTTKSYRNVFSYCFPSYNDDTKNGFLMLGHKTPLPRGGLPLYTKLVQSIKRPILYYVGLEAIFVGQTRLTGFPRFDAATGAGTVLDTGVMFTSLVPGMYEKVKHVVRQQMFRQYKNKNPSFEKNQFDTCYNISINVQSITFMFTNSHNLTLPPPNFIVQIGRSFCLAMTPSSPTNYNLNIIASFQQQYKGITIDVTNSKLTINDNMKRNCINK